MKLIAIEPKIDKYWRNVWSSEERWTVRYKNSWGFIEDDFYDKIIVFQSLFRDKERVKAVEDYIASQVNIYVVCNDVQLEIARRHFGKDMDAWTKLQSESNMFYNTVNEFIAEKPFSGRYIRMFTILGEDTVKLLTLGTILRHIRTRIVCRYKNWKLEQYYKKYPFKYYKSYYPGIEEDRKRFFHNLSVTLSKILPYARNT